MTNALKLTTGILLTAGMALNLVLSIVLYPFISYAMMSSSTMVEYYILWIFSIGLVVVGILLIIDGARESKYI